MIYKYFRGFIKFERPDLNNSNLTEAPQKVWGEKSLLHLLGADGRDIGRIVFDKKPDHGWFITIISYVNAGDNRTFFWDL